MKPIEVFRNAFIEGLLGVIAIKTGIDASEGGIIIQLLEQFRTPANDSVVNFAIAAVTFIVFIAVYDSFRKYPKLTIIGILCGVLVGWRFA